MCIPVPTRCQGSTEAGQASAASADRTAWIAEEPVVQNRRTDLPESEVICLAALSAFVTDKIEEQNHTAYRTSSWVFHWSAWLEDKQSDKSTAQESFNGRQLL